MKKITIVVRQSPFNSVIPSEALRMGVGLTLTNNEVTVIFLDEAVYLFVSLTTETNEYPQIKRHLDTLKELGCELIVEKKSLKDKGLLNKPSIVRMGDKRAIDHIIEKSDGVIVF